MQPNLSELLNGLGVSYTPEVSNSEIDQLEAFKEWVHKAVKVYPDDLTPDGRIHHYSDPYNPKPSNKPIRVRCSVSDSGVVYGWAMDWRNSSVVENYCPEGRVSITEEQIAEYRRHSQEMKRREDEEREKVRLQLQDEYIPSLQKNVDPSLRYIASKNIKAYGDSYQDGETIVLPIVDLSGNVHGIQKIRPSGEKRIYGSHGRGKHVRLDGNNSKILVCEGWSTGCTLREITGRTVFCAMSMNGIGPMVKALKEGGVSNKDIIVCSDNDHRKEENYGLNESLKVGKDHGVEVVYPVFEKSDDGSDFNDLYNLKGAAAVREHFSFEELGPNPLLSVISTGDKAFDLQPIDFLIDGYYQKGEINLVLAAGGTGKSLLTLLDAVCIATGKNLTNREVVESGPVIYYNAEDSMNSIQLRLEAICRAYSVSRKSLSNLHIMSGIDANLKLAEMVDGKVVQGRDYDNLKDLIESIKPVAVVLDPLVKLHQGVSENSNSEMEGVNNLIRRLNLSTESAIILVHHVGKVKVGELRDSNSAGRGASASFDGARVVIAMTGLDDNEMKAAKEMSRNGLTILPENIVHIKNLKSSHSAGKSFSYMEKKVVSFDDVRDKKDRPITVAYLSDTDFEESYRDYVSEKMSEKDRKSNIEHSAVNHLREVLKYKGEMCADEIFGLFQNPMAHGGLPIGLMPSDEVHDFWSDNEKTFKNKMASVISKNAFIFDSSYRGRFKYISAK